MAKPTKAEIKEARKLEWEERAKKEQRQTMFRKIAIWGGSILGIIAFVAILIWLASSPSKETSNITVAPISSKDIQTRSKGNKVTLIEYADFQCPACKSYHPVVNKINSDYKDRLLFVYRFFPLTSIHQNAMISAQAGYAAYLQGKFWEMHDLLFENQDDWAKASDPKSIFEAFAAKIGLNVDQFKKDIDSGNVKKFVTEEQNEGLNAGVSSTPTFVLNGKVISNPSGYDDFKKLIDDALKGK